VRERAMPGVLDNYADVLGLGLQRGLRGVAGAVGEGGEADVQRHRVLLLLEIGCHAERREKSSFRVYRWRRLSTRSG